MLKQVRLPEFDGKRNVDSFFTLFEKAARTLGLQGDEVLSTCLLGRLKGSALAWVSGPRADEIACMTYAELKEALCANFKQHGMTHVRALQRTKQGAAALHDFNADFFAKAQAAGGHITETTIKETYLAGLSNMELRKFLSGFQEVPLAQLMAKALDVAHVYDMYKGGSAASKPKEKHQNPARV